MSRAVAIGSDLRLAGYALAGVDVVHAADAGTVTRLLEGLESDVGLVILDKDPDAAVLAVLRRRPGTVWCSLPK
jgi:vacuolar-type H+-ATPase subunit F/Vma7